MRGGEYIDDNSDKTEKTGTTKLDHNHQIQLNAQSNYLQTLSYFVT